MKAAVGNSSIWFLPAPSLKWMGRWAPSYQPAFRTEASARTNWRNGWSRRGMAGSEAAELIDELLRARVIVAEDAVREPLEAPPADFPLQTLVMNLTNQCNLSCTVLL